MRADLTADQLRQKLHYDYESGEFTWLVGRRKSQIAGSTNPQGYRVVEIDGFRRQCHRLAWLYVYGEWPTLQIDHIDLNKSNNRISNLRLATHSENQMNIRAKSAHGKGVTLHRTGRYQAQIKHMDRNIYLGLFPTQSEALAAYRGAAKVLFGEFARTA